MSSKNPVPVMSDEEWCVSVDKVRRAGEEYSHVDVGGLSEKCARAGLEARTILSILYTKLLQNCVGRWKAHWMDSKAIESHLLNCERCKLVLHTVLKEVQEDIPQTKEP